MQQHENQTAAKTQHTLVGKVVSDKMDRTIAVVIIWRVKDEKYKKYRTRKTKLLVHDENNISKLDDVVLIKSTKPISKRKSWELVKVLS